MSEDQFKREKNYRVSISIAKSMHKKGIITQKEYCKIDAMMKAKIPPCNRLLIRLNRLALYQNQS